MWMKGCPLCLCHRRNRHIRLVLPLPGLVHLAHLDLPRFWTEVLIHHTPRRVPQTGPKPLLPHKLAVVYLFLYPKDLTVHHLQIQHTLTAKSHTKTTWITVRKICIILHTCRLVSHNHPRLPHQVHWANILNISHLYFNLGLHIIHRRSKHHTVNTMVMDFNLHNRLKFPDQWVAKATFYHFQQWPHNLVCRAKVMVDHNNLTKLAKLPHQEWSPESQQPFGKMKVVCAFK